MEMNTDPLFKKEQRARTFLNRWRGSIAELFNYSTSHQSFRIRLWQPGREGNMELRGVGCEYLAGPTSWENSDIQFVRIAEKPHVKYYVYDIGAHFGLWCACLEAAENVKR